MHRYRIVVGMLQTGLGLFWMAQGLGLVRNSSFMVDDPTWAVIGGIVAALGIGLVAWELSRRMSRGTGRPGRRGGRGS